MSLSFMEDAALWNNGMYNVKMTNGCTAPWIVVYGGKVYPCEDHAAALKQMIKCRKSAPKKVYRRGVSVRQSKDRRRYS